VTPRISTVHASRWLDKEKLKCQ